jgi:hypothetical protein
VERGLEAGEGGGREGLGDAQDTDGPGGHHPATGPDSRMAPMDSSASAMQCDGIEISMWKDRLGPVSSYLAGLGFATERKARQGRLGRPKSVSWQCVHRRDATKETTLCSTCMA